ncbi:uncharacterized protein A4U43_C08F22460 [Asparagus officinalis]|nr:uncharacterized protein A4U43_C08F22460 [Asparagus officinalis]
MDAAFKGASEANKPVGGFKISKEAGEWTASNFHPYLSPETYLTCRFFSARKHALVDAVVRNDPTDMTAVVAFPGECEMWGTVAKGEVESLWKVCDGNFEALEYLSEFYNLPQNKRNYDIGISKGKEMVS